MSHLTISIDRVFARFYKKHPHKFNVALIIVIAQLIIELVKLYRQCKQHHPKILVAAKLSEALTRARAWRLARKGLLSQNLDVSLAGGIADALCDELYSSSEQQLAALVQEVESGLAP
jgi:hypothetical protein